MAETDPDDTLAQALRMQVLEAGRAIRAQDIISRQATREVAEQRQRRDASTEVLLAQEIGKLSARMLWLYQHPKRHRFAARSILKMMPAVGTDGRISTAPLTDGQIAQLDGEHLLFSARTISRYPDQPREKQILVRQYVRDETTGAQNWRKLYGLDVYDSPTGERVQVTGAELGIHPDFVEHRGEMQRREVTAYLVNNSWAQRFVGSWCESLLSPSPDGAFFDTGLTTSEYAELDRLNDELGPKMAPGAGWEYPDELFKEPLGIVTQANALLGAGK